MSIILRILDILSTVLILLGIWGNVKDRRMWWIYCVGCAFLGIVSFYKGLWGVGMGGVISVVLGVRNAIYTRNRSRWGTKKK